MVKLDNVSKLAKLVEDKMQINRLIKELAHKVYICGGFSSDTERDYARRLLEMLNEIDREGHKTTWEIANDAVKELTRLLLNIPR